MSVVMTAEAVKYPFGPPVRLAGTVAADGREGSGTSPGGGAEAGVEASKRYPHCWQNVLSSGEINWHLGHFMAGYLL